MTEYEFNCFSYAYKEVGLTTEEVIIPFVSIGLILNNFDIVKNVKEADVLAVMTPFARSSMAIHMAIINEDKRTVRHRRGDNLPVAEGEIDAEISPYLKIEGTEKIFLKLKPGTKLSL